MGCLVLTCALLFNDTDIFFLNRPGRFDRELEIGIPSATDRLGILEALLRKTPHTMTTDELTAIADKTHGYVGADLAAVCNEAGLVAVNRALALSSMQPASSATNTAGSTGGNGGEDIEVGAGGDGASSVDTSAGRGDGASALPSVSIATSTSAADESKAALAYSLTADDLQAGLREVRPSAMREITLDVPKVFWSDIGGQEETKQRLREAVECTVTLF